MSSNYQTNKFPVPEGFQEVLHDFSREVLRDQPENIYYYGYLYFKAMENVIFKDFTFLQGQDFNYEPTKKKLDDLIAKHQDSANNNDE